MCIRDRGWRSPAPRDYVGRAPLCAPESFALWSLTRRLRPVAVLALHTQGEVTVSYTHLRWSASTQVIWLTPMFCSAMWNCL